MHLGVCRKRSLKVSDEKAGCCPVRTLRAATPRERRDTNIQPDHRLFPGLDTSRNFLFRQIETGFVIGSIGPRTCQFLARLSQLVGGTEAAVRTTRLYPSDQLFLLSATEKHPPPVTCLHMYDTSLAVLTGMRQLNMNILARAPAE